MKLLISACLLGVACRYDGESRADARICALWDTHELIPVCPEVMGGLPTPRLPSERVGNDVMRCDGADVTAAYKRGAEEVWRLAKRCGARCAVLKAKSPACGKGCIYDGTFSKTLVQGHGVLAELLLQNGITVLTEDEAAEQFSLNKNERENT